MHRRKRVGKCASIDPVFDLRFCGSIIFCDLKDGFYLTKHACKDRMVEQIEAFLVSLADSLKRSVLELLNQGSVVCGLERIL